MGCGTDIVYAAAPCNAYDLAIDPYSFINLVICGKFSKRELIYLVILGKAYKGT